MYNDNLLLTTQPHDATYGFWVSPAAEFTGKTERLSVSSQTKVSFASYYGGDEFNFTNYFLPLAVQYKTEKDILGFTGGFIRDNTLLGELLDTGLVMRFTQRNQWTANPTWTRQLTEKLSFKSGFQFNDTSYENVSSTSLRDYQLYGGSGGLLYQVTEKDQLHLSGTYINFHTINSPQPLRSSVPGVEPGPDPCLHRKSDWNHTWRTQFCEYDGPDRRWRRHGSQHRLAVRRQSHKKV